MSAQSVPLIDVARPDATSADRFGRIVNVRSLANGSLLINDAGRRQLLLVDQALNNRRVVLDSSSAYMGYGPSEAALAPYTGDSLVLMNRYALSMIDARTGTIVRWTPARMVPMLTLNNGQTVGVDPDGNYVFRASVRPAPATASANGEPAKPAVPVGVDSGLVVRVNFATRAVTRVVKLFQQPSGKIFMNKAEDGRMVARTVVNVLPLADEFAVLSDGTVAVLRVSDYHVDFVNIDGKLESSPKLPFSFVSLTVNDRQILIDSARSAQAAADAAGISTMAREGAAVATGVAVAKATGLNGTKPGEGFKVDVQQTGAVAAGTVAANPGQAVQGTLPFAMRSSDIEYIPAERLPSRHPAFTGGRAMVVDLSDNLWIHTTAKDPSMQNGVMYDVVNRNGALSRRVRIPAGRTVAGFGANGVVYLRFQDDAGWGIERTTALPQPRNR
ncbi:MAG: hypothetical protein H7Z40_11390 [Phycisphaerae bacterium]|nr:hypothetical protein [Gemmatimonadaceae bacterium]